MYAVTAKYFALFFAAALFLAPATSPGFAASGQEELQQATQLVQDLTRSGLMVLRNENAGKDTRQKALNDLLIKKFDLPKMARFVTGRHWRVADEGTRKKFVALFQRYTVLTFLDRIKAFKLNELKFPGADPLPRGGVNVRTVYPNNNNPIELLWVLAKTKDGLRIIDLKIDGVSLRIAQRSEFSSVADRAGGLRGLNDALGRKLVQLEK